MTTQRTNPAVSDVFLEYEGITIYRTYQFDDPISDHTSFHIFTTSPDGAYAFDPFRFDIRTLTVPAVLVFKDSVRAGEETVVTTVLEQVIDHDLRAKPNASSGSRSVQVHQQAL